MLILFLSFKVYSQTYTLNLHVYVTNGTASVDSNTAGRVYTFNNPNTNGRQDYPILSTIKGTSFTFNLSTYYAGCSQNLTVTKSLLELLRDNFTLQSCSTGSGFAGNFYPNSFTPNGITIRNRSATAEVCSGDQLELDADSPVVFPREVYNWQYSLNNKASWLDVPAAQNNSPYAKFSVNDFLGSNVQAYFDKVIYFRLGYGQSKQFTTPIAITFRACAPFITSFTSSGAKCTGEPSNVVVTFDRSLFLNETLQNFQIIKTNGQLTANQIPLLSSFDSTGSLQFTYNNITGLESGSYYTVKYQAFQGTVARGIITTPNNFLYTDPAPLTFELSGNNPVCNNGSGSITITANGGSGEYYYYSLNGGPKIQFTNKTTVTASIVNGVTTETRTCIQQVDLPTNITTTYNILVTDGKDCIEK